MKSHLVLILIAVAVSITGCTGAEGLVGIESAGIIGSHDWSEKPADTASQIPQHESWCYATLGAPECYSLPQKHSPASQLINVDPQNRYPLTYPAYNDMTMDSH